MKKRLAEASTVEIEKTFSKVLESVKEEMKEAEAEEETSIEEEVKDIIECDSEDVKENDILKGRKHNAHIDEGEDEEVDEAEKCPKCGKHTCRTRTQTLVAATYSATGIGLSTRTCTHCGYTSQHRFTIPRLTRTTYHGGGSMGGGFGGFSGGSFGGGSTMGGGAGGKW